MARIRIDDLPLAENLTPEQEELILGAGRRTFRPMLESLENREMMDAGIGAAVMPQMLHQGSQGAQVRLWAKEEVGSLQNQFNQMAQFEAQAGQAIMGQAQQLYANWHAAADQIFAAWSHNAAQMVQNLQALQNTANQMLSSAWGGLTQGQDTRTEGQAVADSVTKAFDQTILHKGLWDITSRDPNSTEVQDLGGGKFRVNFRVTYSTADKTATIGIEVHSTGVRGNANHYVVDHAYLDNYDGVDRNSFETWVKNGSNGRIVGRTLFDMGKLETAANKQIAEKILDYARADDLETGFTPIDGGIRMRVTLMKSVSYETNPDCYVAASFDVDLKLNTYASVVDSQFDVSFSNYGGNAGLIQDVKAAVRSYSFVSQGIEI